MCIDEVISKAKANNNIGPSFSKKRAALGGIQPTTLLSIPTELYTRAVQEVGVVCT